MQATRLMDAGDSALVVIDVQGRRAPAIDAGAEAVARTRILLQAAEMLEVPVLATEQYPRGLGETLPEVAELLPAGATVEKIDFSACRCEAFRDRLAAFGRRQLVVCGMETHVCVLQTALELCGEGYEVFVVADACGSRHPGNKAAGLDRMAAAGCRIVTSEMAVFEWLGKAGTPLFRKVSALIK